MLTNTKQLMKKFKSKGSRKKLGVASEATLVFGVMVLVVIGCEGCGNRLYSTLNMTKLY
jgi:hypothetical protein